MSVRILSEVLSGRVCYKKKSSSLSIMTKTQDCDSATKKKEREHNVLFLQTIEFRWERVLRVYTKETYCA